MLSDLKILEFANFLPGPYATMLLADLGAEVIKIERPQIGDPLRRVLHNGEESARFQAVNRHKKSITMNLKHPESVDIIESLVMQYDILIESFRPGVMPRLGLGYDELRKVNSSLIYVSISGYGQTGPMAETSGHDLNYQATAGICYLNGDLKGNPVLPGMPIADMFGGAAMTLLSILSSVRERDKTGKGTHIDISMTDGVMSMASAIMAGIFNGEEGARSGLGMLTGRNPNYQLYQTKDGSYMALAAIEKHFWRNFCLAVDREDLVSQANGGTEVIEQIAHIFAQKTRNEWIEFSREVDCCLSPVLTPSEAIGSELALKRNMSRFVKNDGKHGFQTGFPIKFSNYQPVRKPSIVPKPGQDTESVLHELGYTECRIKCLKDQDLF